MSIKICHASIDENGKTKNGSVGDQTGKEVCVRYWYSKPWNVMLRYKDTNVALQAAEIAKKLANSNLVGYDQNQRNTLYNKLVKYNWNVDAYIASGEKSETDCSAFMYACYCVLIPSMRASGNAPTTQTMKSKFMANGFTAYSTVKYLSSDAYLMVGDVLVKEGSHTVMAIENGSKVTTTTATISGTTYDGVDYSPVFDATYYASRYIDLADAGITSASALFSHFINNGMKECRQASANFNVLVYKNNYADLTFGDNMPLYYKHYCTNGKNENRIAI